MASSVRMFQQNVARSKYMAIGIKILGLKERIDLVVLHEPFLSEGETEIFSKMKVITGAESGKIPLSAIVIFNNELEVMKIEELCSDRCVCVRIGNKNFNEDYIVSLFCPADVEIDQCLLEFRALMNILGDKNVIFCVETNARSVWWSCSEESDDRGEQIENFILANRLCVLNRKDPLRLRTARSDYTELTLSTYHIIQRIPTWVAVEQWTASKNRLIGIEFYTQNHSTKDQSELLRSSNNEGLTQNHSTKDQSESLRSSNTEGLTQNHSTKDQSESLRSSNGEELNSVRSSDHAICQQEKNGNSAIIKESESEKRSAIPWWNSTLAHLKHLASEAKKNMQKEPGNEYFEFQYFKIRREYTRAFRRAQADYNNKELNPECDREKTETGLSRNVIEGANELNFKGNSSVLSSTGSTTSWNISSL